MSDRMFERAVLDWLEDGSDRTPPAAVDAVLLAVKTTPQQRDLRIPRRFPQMTSPVRLLAAAIALVAVVGGGAIWFGRTNPPPTSTQSPIPSGAPVPTALPSPTPQPSPSTRDEVTGWPRMNGSGPGLYSWDGGRCAWTAGASCGAGFGGGFMHNCYGPCDVAITISFPTEVSVADGRWSAVTIVERPGWYRRAVEPEPSPVITPNGPLYEEWMVEIDGVPVVIKLWAEPDASDAGLADAHAIIASLRSEPSTFNARGFRLVFRLTNSAWDSG